MQARRPPCHPIPRQGRGPCLPRTATPVHSRRRSRTCGPGRGGDSSRRATAGLAIVARRILACRAGARPTARDPSQVGRDMILLVGSRAASWSPISGVELRGRLVDRESYCHQPKAASGRATRSRDLGLRSARGLAGRGPGSSRPSPAPCSCAISNPGRDLKRPVEHDCLPVPDRAAPDRGLRHGAGEVV